MYITDFFSLRLVQDKKIIVKQSSFDELIQAYKETLPSIVVVRRYDIRNVIRQLLDVESFPTPSYIVHLDEGESLYALNPVKHIPVGSYISLKNYLSYLQVYKVDVLKT